MSPLNTTQVSLAFQPIIDLHSGRIAYLETYLRLATHDQRARIQEAENDGSIAELDLYVLSQALPLMHKGHRLALNISPQTVFRQQERFTAPLLALPVAKRPIIEINDPYLLDVDDQRRLAKILYGLEIGLNHYQGTALENEVLVTIQPHWVKLDGAPIDSTFADQGCNQLQQALTVCQRQRIELVITRIENAERLAHIRHLCGARWGQGYYLAGESNSPDFPPHLPLPLLDGNLRPPPAGNAEACWHCLYSRLSGDPDKLQPACG